MATIKYQVKENTTIGTHSFFAQAVSYSTLDISDLAEEISESIGISPALIAAIIQRYAVVAEQVKDSLDYNGELSARHSVLFDAAQSSWNVWLLHRRVDAVIAGKNLPMEDIK